MRVAMLWIVTLLWGCTTYDIGDSWLACDRPEQAEDVQTSFDYATATPLGYSGDDLIAAVRARSPLQISWNDPAIDTAPFDLAFILEPGAEEVAYQPAYPGDPEEPACGPTLAWMDVPISASVEGTAQYSESGATLRFHEGEGLGFGFSTQVVLDAAAWAGVEDWAAEHFETYADCPHSEELCPDSYELGEHLSLALGIGDSPWVQVSVMIEYFDGSEGAGADLTPILTGTWAAPTLE